MCVLKILVVLFAVCFQSKARVYWRINKVGTFRGWRGGIAAENPSMAQVPKEVWKSPFVHSSPTTAYKIPHFKFLLIHTQNRRLVLFIKTKLRITQQVGRIL